MSKEQVELSIILDREWFFKDVDGTSAAFIYPEK
jgi:hypothetical protein